jgi:hypothetical protein
LRRPDSVVLRFRAHAREQVEELARREHACCPSVDYRDGYLGRLADGGVHVERAGDERFELR